MDRLQSKLDSVDVRMNQEILFLESQVNSGLTYLDTRLHSMDQSMSSDFNGIKTELSGVSNTANRLCDKIEEHDAQMATDLMEVNRNLSQKIFDNSGGFECGGTRGWRCAVYLDMEDANTVCPSGWQLTTYSKRTCSQINTGQRTCDSAVFPVSGGKYSQVCGRIRGYQAGEVGGLAGCHSRRLCSLDDAYFGGVAVMHGNPRQHIWTFAAGVWENSTGSYGTICPCDKLGRLWGTPPSVGDDFFCESGVVYPGYRDRELYAFQPNDTLWDGQDCHHTSTCCSLHNPPYFTKTLNETTTDDIELRSCRYTGAAAIELVELYIK
jgi:hypothetical protein